MPDVGSSYRDILALPGMARILGSALLARTAAQMYALVLVLFVLARYHSPQLAGLAVLCSILPGLLLSPIAGAILDRGARTRLIIADYLVGAAASSGLCALALVGRVPSFALLTIVAIGSLTQPLSSAGLRSVLPLIAPRPLWDRVNAIDSGTYLIASVAGPGLGGVAVAVLGSSQALVVPAVALVAGAALLPGLVVPAMPAPSTRLFNDAWLGLCYVVTNGPLRMLAIMVSIFNIGGGALTVALPLLVVRHLHGGSAETGVLFAVMGAAGILSGLITGRFNSEGRERAMLTIGGIVSAAALVMLALAPGAVAAVAAMAVMGLGNGPLDLGLFSLRQRSTGPEWFGRAFAVSMSLNYVGIPLGAAFAGPIAARSVSVALVIAAGMTLISAAVPPIDDLVAKRT